MEYWSFLYDKNIVSYKQQRICTLVIGFKWYKNSKKNGHAHPSLKHCKLWFNMLFITIDIE